MSTCDGIISKGLEARTCVPAKKGYERKAVIINRSDIDWDKVVRSTTASNVITALPLLKGKKGYVVSQYGRTPFTGSTDEGVIGTYANGVTHNVVIAQLENDRDLNEKFGDGLLNGEFVLILEKKDKGTSNNSAFVLVGFDNGAVLSAYSADAYGDAAGGGVYTLTEENASNVALYLGETYSAGKTISDSLTAVAA